MFFILSKVLLFLIKPLNWVVILFVLGLLVKKPALRKKLLAASLIVLLFFTNGFIANILLRSWETDPVPIASLPAFDTGIVLTGITNQEIKPRDRVYFNKGADRVTHAARLYKEGKISKILISGGTGKLIEYEDDIPEADNLVRFYHMAGIPAEDIIVENQAMNTRQSAINCRDILEKQFPGGKHLLITSAFHQRRAKACFDKVNLETLSYSCDFHTDRSGEFNFSALILPSSNALHQWEILLKEWTGLAAYKIMGYI